MHVFNRAGQFLVLIFALAFVILVFGGTFAAHSQDSLQPPEVSGSFLTYDSLERWIQTIASTYPDETRPQVETELRKISAGILSDFGPYFRDHASQISTDLTTLLIELSRISSRSFEDVEYSFEFGVTGNSAVELLRTEKHRKIIFNLAEFAAFASVLGESTHEPAPFLAWYLAYQIELSELRYHDERGEGERYRRLRGMANSVGESSRASWIARYTQNGDQRRSAEATWLSVTRLVRSGINPDGVYEFLQRLSANRSEAQNGQPPGLLWDLLGPIRDSVHSAQVLLAREVTLNAQAGLFNAAWTTEVLRSTPLDSLEVPPPIKLESLEFALLCKRVFSSIKNGIDLIKNLGRVSTRVGQVVQALEEIPRPAQTEPATLQVVAQPSIEWPPTNLEPIKAYLESVYSLSNFLKESTEREVVFQFYLDILRRWLSADDFELIPSYLRNDFYWKLISTPLNRLNATEKSQVSELFESFLRLPSLRPPLSRQELLSFWLLSAELNRPDALRVFLQIHSSTSATLLLFEDLRRVRAGQPGIDYPLKEALGFIERVLTRRELLKDSTVLLAGLFSSVSDLTQLLTNDDFWRNDTRESMVLGATSRAADLPADSIMRIALRTRDSGRTGNQQSVMGFLPAESEAISKNLVRRFLEFQLQQSENSRPSYLKKLDFWVALTDRVVTLESERFFKLTYDEMMHATRNDQGARLEALAAFREALTGKARLLTPQLSALVFRDIFLYGSSVEISGLGLLSFYEAIKRIQDLGQAGALASGSYLELRQTVLNAVAETLNSVFGRQPTLLREEAERFLLSISASWAEANEFLGKLKTVEVGQGDQDLGTRLLVTLSDQLGRWTLQERWELVLYLRGDQAEPPAAYHEKFSRMVPPEYFKHLVSQQSIEMRSNTLAFILTSGGPTQQEFESLSDMAVRHTLRHQRDSNVVEKAVDLISALFYAMKEARVSALRVQILGFILANYSPGESIPVGVLIKQVLSQIPTLGPKIGQFLRQIRILGDQGVHLQDLEDKSGMPTLSEAYEILHRAMGRSEQAGRAYRDTLTIRRLLGGGATKIAVLVELKVDSELGRAGEFKVVKVVREEARLTLSNMFTIIRIAIDRLAQLDGPGRRGFLPLIAGLRGVERALHFEVQPEHEVESSNRIRANVAFQETTLAGGRLSNRVPEERILESAASDRVIIAEFAPGVGFSSLLGNDQIEAARLALRSLRYNWRTLPRGASRRFNLDLHGGNILVDLVRDRYYVRRLTNAFIDNAASFDMTREQYDQIVDIYSFIAIWQRFGLHPGPVDKLGASLRLSRDQRLNLLVALQGVLERNVLQGSTTESEVETFHRVLEALQTIEGYSIPDSFRAYPRYLINVDNIAAAGTLRGVKPTSEVDIFSGHVRSSALQFFVRLPLSLQTGAVAERFRQWSAQIQSDIDACRAAFGR